VADEAAGIDAVWFRREGERADGYATSDGSTRETQDGFREKRFLLESLGRCGSDKRLLLESLGRCGCDKRFLLESLGRCGR